MRSLDEWQMELEAAVRARRTQRVCQEIPHFLLRYQEQKPDLLFMACDWYRRIGHFERAYRLLQFDPARRPGSRHVLWAARMLNLLGATEFAREHLRYVEPRTAEDHRFMGTIELTAFEHESAHRHFVKMRELNHDPGIYAFRLAQISFADSLAGMGRYDEAIAAAQEVGATSSEPLLQGIALQAQGEYLVKSGDFRPALAMLERAAGFFPKEDPSPDYGVLLKWTGYAQVQCGRKRAGAENLDRAIIILRKHGLRFEAWLDALRLKGEVGLLTSREFEAIAIYPGLASGFRKMLPRASTRRLQGKTTSEMTVELAADEYSWNGKRYLGVPLEVRAAALLGLAGDWGIPMARLKSLLWQDQFFAFIQLETRLWQVLRRIKSRYGLEVHVSGGIASLAPSSRVRMEVVGSEGDSEPSFFEGRAKFSRRDLEAHYTLSQARCCVWLSKWEDAELIERVGGGRSAKYRVRR